MKAIFSIIFILTNLYTSFSQQHDNLWISMNLGWDSFPSDPPYPANFLHFTSSPPVITYVESPYSMHSQCLSVCNEAGIPLFFSNGYALYHTAGELMENGDGLNPNPLPNSYPFGYPSRAFMMALPTPGHPNDYSVLHLQFGWDSIWWLVPDLLMTSVQGASAPGLGKVTVKNKPVISGAYWLEYFNATKHANGRDWWVVLSDANADTQVRTFYSYLLGPDSIALMNTQIINDYGPVSERWYNYVQPRVFSSDGNFFISIDVRDSIQGVRILPFDRCTGLLGKAITFPFPLSYWGPGGIAVSPDSRWLYLSNSKFVFQYDLHATDIPLTLDTVGVFDGYTDEYGPTFFAGMQLGPDGKIYFDYSSRKTVNYIALPNKRGKSCRVLQRALTLPVPPDGIPYYPNYRLGPIDGSPCDTLGIDNEPLADFWWFADSTLSVEFADNSAYEPTHWHWDFGDGTMSSDTNPVHTFPAPGVYLVCLTVSNAYAEDTVCKEVPVGVSGVKTPGMAMQEPTLCVSPNPATDKILVRWSEPFPKNGVLEIFDRTGALKSTMNVPAQARSIEVQITGLPTGVYFCRLVSNNKVLGAVKFFIQT